MAEYPSNSHKSKGTGEAKSDIPQKDVKKIVNDPVKVKKTGLAKKFAKIFMAEDAKTVGSYIFTDILLPTARKAIYDIITGGAGMLLLGDKPVQKSSIPASTVSYQSYYRNPNGTTVHTNTPVRQVSYDWDQVEMTRSDAEMVLNEMRNLIERYGIVSVADMHDLMGITSKYTDNYNGWTDLSMARIARVMSGNYIIELPRAMQIN